MFIGIRWSILFVLTFRYASFDILRQAQDDIAQDDIAQNDIAQDDTTFFMCLVFCHTEVLEV